MFPANLTITLKIENAYVRAYYVEVPPHGETQLHQHDRDYIFVTLGASDVTSAVLGKPEAHLVLKDGEVHFTRGGFAHVARNNSGAPFRNVTIEFLRIQENPRNRCVTVMPGAPGENCDETSETGPPRPTTKGGSSNAVSAPQMTIGRRSLFETDEIHVQEWSIRPSFSVPSRTSLGLEFGPGHQENQLFVGLGPDPLKLRSGKDKASLGSGEMFWLSSRPKIEFETPLSATRGASFIVVSFKGSSSPK